ncbi:Piso0_002764 [Millerozyma farinosa CBS 7064]|uniref:ATPase expression protein 2, mitochondrial n=1 Tax=Pichia sorbitophila (strain ATCC MYA-4447 / BCRC 22081 / CBS 7064 / NBRC 10061 / NRRL Y-12695) TaxID=559304 RepID=G8YFW9_PICSO|nr:Piso0_002764 [Millerozyma farinosa CBS 7064]
MASIIRRSKTSKASPVLSRFLSAPAISISSTSIAGNAAGSAAENSELKKNRVKQLQGKLNDYSSEAFLKSLSFNHFSSTFKEPVDYSKTDLIRKKVFNLINTKQYHVLAELILNWTAPKSSIMDWREVFTQTEFSHIIGKLIDFQISLSHALINQKVISGKDEGNLKYTEARNFRDRVRRIYSNLLFSDGSFIYEKKLRANMHTYDRRSDYIMSMYDYENLIRFELHNQKIDLAAKWFLRLEQQYPGGLHYEFMTKELWKLKFQVYSGGAHYLWKDPKSEYYLSFYNPRKGLLTSEQNWRTVFSEYSKFGTRNGRGSPIVDNELGEILVYCIGYSGDVDYLLKFIESVWGVPSDPKNKTSTRVCIPGDIKYPTISTLKAILVSLAYNKQFFKGMSYINKFQDIYKELDLSGKDARSFWSTVFKWSELSTRSDADRVLLHYLKTTDVPNVNLSKNPSLQELQENTYFDYEGYISLSHELKDKRKRTMEQLWGIYTSNNCFFSPSVFRTYLDFLLEDRSERHLYEYMTELGKFYHLYHTSERSFNRIYSKSHLLSDTDKSIYTLYKRALRGLVDAKWQNGYAGQCPPLLEEWSLNTKMQKSLMSYFERSVIPEYNKMMDKKRHEVMVKQRSEEGETFLDLF